MYYDDKTGMFKGEALVVYFKAESVELAIQMFDETSIRAAIGQQTGQQQSGQKLMRGEKSRVSHHRRKQ